MWKPIVRVRASWGLVAVLTATPAFVHAQEKSPVLSAMEAELARSVAGYKAKAETAPYFLGYAVTDTNATHIAAQYGALQDKSSSHRRELAVDVRVGSPELDNTHHVRGERHNFFEFPHAQAIAIEDDLPALRASLWLETDRRYKAALTRYLQVTTNRAVKADDEDKSADFSSAPASQLVGPLASTLVDTPAWQDKLKQYSGLLNRPEIYQSTANLSVEATNKFLVSSDGTSLQHGQSHVRLAFMVETRAEDGMDLDDARIFDATSIDGLPDDTTIRQAIAQLTDNLIALRRAPLVEPYTGPAILSARAAAVFFHEIFGHRIEGHRQKDEDEGQTFTKKINQQILPTFLSVVDDPTQAKFGAVDLNGSYDFDDEGVRAQPVVAVEHGIMKSFLMSRSPIAGFAQSNGHGRAAAGFAPVGRQGNLFVRADEHMSAAKLRGQLIEQAKRQGKTYGLLFQDISGGFTNTGRSGPQAFEVNPVLVYKVFTDGRPDELVRGVDLIGTPLTSLSKIVAAGDSPEVFNGYCGAESGWVPVAAVAPSLLTTQIEVQKRENSANRPPLLPAPMAAPEGKLAGEPDVVLRAMRDELTRNASDLRLGELEKPYYLEYEVGDVVALEIDASFGALVHSQYERSRPARVAVRVGSYDVDSSEFVGQRSWFANFSPARGRLVLDNDYAALRRDLWLATDNSYKQALEQIAAKRAALRNTEEKEPAPDFAPTPATTFLPPAKPVPALECKKWEDLTRRLSALFRAYPQIETSRIELRIATGTSYFLTSEGTTIREPGTSARLVAQASTHAADGMPLSDFASFYGNAVDELPAEARAAAAVNAMAKRLSERAAARVLDKYAGPVLFSDQASGELFARILAPELSGQRPPLCADPRTSAMTHSSLVADRIGRPVLPENFSVVDDPGKTTFRGEPLAGNYRFDDEGVPAQAVRLVDKGVLKTLLMSRRPRKEIPAANGHGRRMGGGIDALVANLFIQASGGKSDAELEHDLRKSAKDAGLEYGIRIARMDDRTLSGSDGLALMMSGARGRQASPLGTALLVYKVYVKDGHKELVRGLSLQDFGLRTLKEIRAAGRDLTVNNTAASSASLAAMFSWASGMGADSVPAAVIAPAVLFPDLELSQQALQPEKPPLLPHPFFTP